MKRLLLAGTALTSICVLAGLSTTNTGIAQTTGTVPVQSVVVPIGQKPALEGILPTTPAYNQLPTTPGAGPTSKSFTSQQHGPDTEDVDKYFSGNQGGLKTSHSAREYINQKLDSIQINNDIAIQPKDGEYVISLISYSGASAPKLAREMVYELRKNPKYGLPAFVSTKGEEDIRKELKKVSDYVQWISNQMAQSGLSPDTPIRVPVIRYEIQCAVLIGGWPTMEEARKALERIRKLDPSDLPKTALNKQRVLDTSKKGQFAAANPGKRDDEMWYVNPFLECMVGRNPSLAEQRTASDTAEHLAFLRKLNENEPYSLFNNPHKYTLAIKEFLTGRGLDKSAKSSGSFLDKLKFWESDAPEDYAAINAHNMAEQLRKANIGLETYVLHDKYSSCVFVGGYDSKEDPRLKHDQETLPQINNWATGQLGQVMHVLKVPRVTEVPR